MKPFLILQLRPEPDASDDEFLAFLTKGGLTQDEVHRIRLDQQDIPTDLSLSDYSGIIVGGGPGCVSDAPAKKQPIEAKIEAECLALMPEITARDLPFLGCCYGIGILGHHLEPGLRRAQRGDATLASWLHPTRDVGALPVSDDPLWTKRLCHAIPPRS